MRETMIPFEPEPQSLVEVLDRTLEKGVHMDGEITVSVAGIDLLFIGLKALVTSAERAEKLRAEARTQVPE